MKHTRMLVLFLLATLMGCGSPVAVTSPSLDLTGSWMFSFSALTPRSCPGSADRPVGCAGEGRLTLDQRGEAVEGTVAFRGYCQACGVVAEFSGQPQPLSGAVREGRLDVGLGSCRYSAVVTADHADDLSGDVRCSLLGIAPVRGAWRMSRQD